MESDLSGGNNFYGNEIQSDSKHEVISVSDNMLGQLSMGMHL